MKELPADCHCTAVLVTQTADLQPQCTPAVGPEMAGARKKSNPEPASARSWLALAVAICLVAFFAHNHLSHNHLSQPDGFPTLFFKPKTHANVRAHPESLKGSQASLSGSNSFDTSLLPLSEVEAVARRVERAAPDSSQLWRNPCTINRLTEPIRDFASFVKANGTEAAIIASGAGVVPPSVTDYLSEEIVPAGKVDDVVSCLCNPGFGTNFDDDGKKLAERYCLWQFGLVTQYLLEPRGVAEGAMSNRELADRLRFQCRFSSNAEIAQMVNRVLKQLFESSNPLVSRFWESMPVQQKVIMWLSSADTRTPSHTDDYDQVLFQLRGTKHVTVSTDASLEQHPWAHGGPFNRTLYNSVGMTNTERECLLRPGEMLWLPFGLSHDIYSLEPSHTITLRFPDWELGPSSR